MPVQLNLAIWMIVATTASVTVELLVHHSERSSLHTIKRAPCILLKLKELLAYHSERSSSHTIKRAPCKVNK